MKKISSKIKLKSIMALTLIFTMLISLFTPFASIGVNDNGNEYINFSINWANGTSELNAVSGTTQYAPYNLQFSGVPTGFKNVVIHAQDKESGETVKTIYNWEALSGSVSAISQANQYNESDLIFSGTVSSGVSVSGTLMLNFPVKEDSERTYEYDRTIEVSVSGEYQVNDTEEVVKLENIIEPVELNVHVTPENQVTDFTTQMAVGSNGNNITKIAADTSLGLLSSTNYQVTNIKANYYLNLESIEYTQDAILDITIKKTSALGNTLSDTYTCNWGGLDTKFGTPTKIENLDGTVTYRFSIGTASETFDKERCITLDSPAFSDIKANGKTDLKDYLISVNYPITDPEGESNVSYSMTSEFTANGWVITKDTTGTSETKKNVKIVKNHSDSTNTYACIDGNYSWITVNNYRNGVITKDSLQELLSDGSINLSFRNSSTIIKGPNETIVNGVIKYNAPEIKYLSDEGELKSLTLNSGEMNLNEITMGDLSTYCETVTFELMDSSKNKIQDLVNANTYNVSDKNLSEYYINCNDCCKYLNMTKNSSCNVMLYEMNYTLSLEKLRESGLSDSEISNIYSIENRMSTTSSSTLFEDGDTIATYDVTGSEAYRQSYMETTCTDLNADVSDVGQVENEAETVTISMYKNTGVITNSSVSVKNVNPRFYIKLSDDFEIDYSSIDVNITNGKGLIYILASNPYEKVCINGTNYLVVNCEGTYDSSAMGNAKTQVTVSFKKKLVNDTPSASQTLDVFMVTDNENYVSGVSNFDGLQNSNGIEAQKFQSKSFGFSIEMSNTVESLSGINHARKWEIWTTAIQTKGIEDNPIPIDGGKEVTILGQIRTNGQKINNVSFVSKIPVTGNTYVTNSNSLNSEIDLIDLKDITVYIEKRGAEETVLAADQYTVEYSESTSANFDSAYTAVTSTTDLSNAKALKITLANSLPENTTVYVKYKMTMPNEVIENSKAGAVTAVRYTPNNSTEPIIIEPAAIYVKRGDTSGTVNITKTFEGYDAGTAPEGISLEGIQFKLINIDGDTEETLVLSGQTDTNGIFTTDAEGKITLTKVPMGKYRLEEISEFDGFEKIAYREIEILFGNVEGNPFTIENPRKQGNITINKEWLDTNDQQGAVTFEVTRTSEDNINYKETVTKLANNTSTVIYGVPYGEYKITEKSGPTGWAADSSEVAVTLDEESVETTVTNRIAKGTLKITKTVPEGDTVNGLVFDITGVGTTSYTDTTGTIKTINTDYSVIVGHDYSTTENIDVTVSEDQCTAEILISNVPVGTYTIEEVQMPVLEDGTTERYVAVKRTAQLTKEAEIKEVDITNQWKKGTLKIVKTSAEGVDLTQFKVRVTCDETRYGSSFDKIYTFPESGILTIPNLVLGTYKVEEVESDYFNAYYTNDNTQPGRLEPYTYEVNYNKMATAYIYNEPGYGVVKILKTMEGKDAERAVGIKFAISGYDQTGEWIYSEIELDKTETIDGVKYATGVSEEVMAGGEYVVSEINTPDYFEDAEEVSIDVTKRNGVDNPVVLNIENKRAKGTLEMSTTTVPAGGILNPIQYRVVEVEFNADNSYTEVEGTEQLVDAEADGTAMLTKINAGNYYVELTKIPDGYTFDLPQLIEVPSNDTGYAEFEIERDEVMENTTLNISKEILNSNNEIATDGDFEKAKLNSAESFEVKIINTQTNEEYYAFMDKDSSGKVKGLGAGTYSIEEVYKPKYENVGYALKIGEVYAPIEADEDGKYLFTIGTEIEGTNEIELKITNKIDTTTGFGGQDIADNLSKVDVESEEIVTSTKAIVYVMDEQRKGMAGVQFKVYDSEGNAIQHKGQDFVVTTTENKKIMLKGLEAGTYTLKCISVPDGYLVPEDKQLIVYKDAVRVVSVEIQLNIPRGSLTLSAVYTNEEGKEINPTRSKYQVYNPETKELLTFTKNMNGTYTASNLPTATDTIPVRSRSMIVTGIPANVEYQVALVDVTSKYGVANEVPETVTVVEDATQEVKVPVKPMAKFVSVKTNDWGYGVFAIDEEQKLWVSGASYSMSTKIVGIEADEHGCQLVCATDMQDSNLYGIKVKDIDCEDCGGNFVAVVDSNGKVWTMGYKNALGYASETDTTEFTCISDIDGNPLKGVKIEKIFVTQDSQDSQNRYGEVGYNNDVGVFALDENGKVWSWGDVYENQASNATDYVLQSAVPVCLSTDEFGLKNVVITDIQAGAEGLMAMDSNNNLWVAGYNNGTLWLPYNSSDQYNRFECVTNREDSKLYNVKIKSISLARGVNSAVVDVDGKIWTYARSQWICCSDVYESLAGVVFDQVVAGGYMDWCAVDQDGKLWSWGKNDTGVCGNGTTVIITEPTCITDLEDSTLKDIKLKQVDISYNVGTALDDSGNLWLWGNYGTPIGTSVSFDYGSNKAVQPTKWTPSRNYVFTMMDFVKVDFSGYHAIALDKNGRIWSWGNDLNDGIFLYSPNSYDYNIYTPKCISGNSAGSILNDANIIDVAVAFETSYALDDTGKLWAWGASHTIPGKLNYNNNRTAIPICVNDIEGNTFNGINIKSIYTGYDDYNVGVLDDEGKAWVWGESYSNAPVPICINTASNIDTKFTKMALPTSTSSSSKAVSLLDENGDVWLYNTTATGNLSDTIPMLKDVKIVDIAYSGRELILLDENGKVYIYALQSYGYWGDGTSVDSSSVNTCKCLNEIEGNPLYGKVITQVSSNYNAIQVVDSDGKLWSWGSNYEYCIGSDTIADSGITYTPICVSDTIEVSKIWSKYCSTIIKDKNGVLYGFGGTYSTVPINGTGKECAVPTKLIGTTVYSTNDAYNQNIVSVTEKGAVTASGEVLNFKNLGEASILEKSDKEVQNGTTKYELVAKERPTNVKENYTKTDRNGNVVFEVILDENGKIWTYGSCDYGGIGDGLYSRNYYVCLSDTKNHPLKGITITDIDFGAIEYANRYYYDDGDVLAADSEGNLWYWGKNSIIPQKAIKDESIKISEIKRVSEDDIMVFESDENLYQLIGESEYNVQVSKVEFSEEVTISKIYENGGSYYIATEEGGLWTLEDGVATKVPGLGNAKVESITFSRNSSGGLYGGGILILDSEGSLWAWGESHYGLLQTGDTSTYSEVITVPTMITGFDTTKIKSVEAFYYGNYISESSLYENYIIVKDENGALWSWGSNIYGILGNGTGINLYGTVPKKITCGTAPIEKFEISTYGYGNCSCYAIDADGVLWMWGRNSSGKLGTGNVYTQATPYCVNRSYSNTADVKFASVSVQEQYSSSAIWKHIGITKAIDTEGKTWVWGYDSGTLGIGSTAAVAVPTCLTDKQTEYGFTHASTVIECDLEKHFTTIIKDTTGKYWAWGSNAYGQFGNGTTTVVSTPICLSTKFAEYGLEIDEFVYVDDEYGRTFIVKDTDGKYWGLGYNSNGQFGTGDTNNVTTPRCLSTELGFTADKFILANENVIIAIDTDGYVWSCGNGHIKGIGSYNTISTAVKISDTMNLKDAKAIVTTENTGYAIDKNGQLWVWGETNDACGITESSSIIPTAIESLNNCEQISIVTSDSDDYWSSKYAALVLASDKNVYALDNYEIRCLTDSENITTTSENPDGFVLIKDTSYGTN